MIDKIVKKKIAIVGLIVITMLLVPTKTPLEEVSMEMSETQKLDSICDNEVLSEAIEDNVLRTIPIEDTMLLQNEKTKCTENEKNDLDYSFYSIGKSGLGEEIMLYNIPATTESNENILLVFEMHGYEDYYPKDGQLLVAIGNEIANHYIRPENRYSDYNLYIIPSLNPDGLTDGKTSCGPGRCQVSLGVDINRDFGYKFVPNLTGRNKTLNEPFSSPESILLRDLVLSKDEWVIIIDIHGWLNQVIGTKNLSKMLYKELDLGEYLRYTDMNGQFIRWASQYSQNSALIELSNKVPKSKEISEEVNGLIKALDMFCTKSREK